MKVKGFYFSPANRRLENGDNRVIRVGRTHKVTGKIIPCDNGLHASVRMIDALEYASGSILYRVELSGDVVAHGDPVDKYAASMRRYLASFNAGSLLLEFARKQALINIAKIKSYCTDANYNLIVRWLKTGDESIRTASLSAADSDAYYAARSAANEMLKNMVREKTGWKI